MKYFTDNRKMFALLLPLLVTFELVICTPLPQEDTDAEREGRAFIGFSFFAPPARVEPVQCVATNGLLTIGTCYNKQSCIEAGGVDSGTCPTGGVCCVIPSVCGSTIARNLTWFVNKDFPERTRDAGDCIVTIKKEFPRVKQARLDFQSLQLEGPYQGRCSKDAFVVSKVGNVNGREKEEEIVPKLCGDNNNQHVYVDMEQDEVRIRVKLDAGSLSRGASPGREWRVLVTQLDDHHIAPPNCLQYHSEGKSEVRSLNYGATDDFRDDLNYDICFSKLSRSDKAEESCTRKFTNVNIDQTKSYREQNNVRRRKMKKNKNNRSGRSVESRELPARSPPAQSLPSNKVSEAFSDVISLVSRTVAKVKNETDHKKSGDDVSTTAEQITEAVSVYTSEENSDSTTVKYESNGQTLSESLEKNNDNLAVEAPGGFPMFYSAGDEAVISQIQRVVLQLQQEQLGIGGLGVNQGEFSGFDSQTEAKLLEDTTPDFLSSEVTETSDVPDYSTVTNSVEIGVNVIDADDTDDEVRNNNLDEDSKGIEDSVSTISNILGDLLYEFSATTVNVPEVVAETLPTPEAIKEADMENDMANTLSEPVTDNLAVEGSVTETVLTPEGIKVASMEVENDNEETAPETVTDNLTAEVLTPVDIEVASIAVESDEMAMSSTIESGSDDNNDMKQDSPTEMQEESVEALQNDDLDLNAQVLVTETYDNLDNVSTIPSGMNTAPASDTQKDFDGIKGESDSAHAEITVLDPESVQVLGDLVIKNQLNDDDTSTTESLIDDTDDAIVNIDVTPSITEADYTAATTDGIPDVKEPVLIDELEASLSEKVDEDIAPADTSSDNSENTEKQSDNEIQWLILEGDSTGNKDTKEPSLAIPPEVVISSDIGFGFNSNDTENEDVSSTEKDNSEMPEDNDTDINDRNVNDASGDTNLSSVQDTANNDFTSDITVSTSKPVNLYQAQPQESDASYEEDTQEHNGNVLENSGSLGVSPENEMETNFEADESMNNEAENTPFEAPVEDFIMPVENQDSLLTNEDTSGNDESSGEMPDPTASAGMSDTEKMTDSNGVVEDDITETGSSAESQMNESDNLTGSGSIVDNDDMTQGNESPESDITGFTSNSGVAESYITGFTSNSEVAESDITGFTSNSGVAESDKTEENSPIEEAIIDVSEDDTEAVSNDNVDITIHATSFDSAGNDNTDYTEDDSDNATEEEEEEEALFLPEVVFPSDEEQCGGSFLKVQEKIICGAELRQETLEGVNHEDERFRDVERISVRALEGARQSLRFELRYETQCPESKDDPTTPKPPVRKTVTLLQYLLGWYR